MYELIIHGSPYFKIEQIKADYYLTSLTSFVILPGHTKLDSKIEINFDHTFLCLIQLERPQLEHGLLLQAIDFPNGILNIDLVNLKNTPFFVEANTKIAKINFTQKQFLDCYFVFKNNDINQQ